MRNRSCIDSIDDDYKSAVDLSIYRGGGLDPLHNWFRANPTNIANNRNTKLGTLICSAHARTVRPTGADRPDRGLSGLRAGLSAGSKPVRTYVYINDANWSIEIWVVSLQFHSPLTSLGSVFLASVSVVEALLSSPTQQCSAHARMGQSELKVLG
jgi:hypothetical protein